MILGQFPTLRTTGGPHIFSFAEISPSFDLPTVDVWYHELPNDSRKAFFLSLAPKVTLTGVRIPVQEWNLPCNFTDVFGRKWLLREGVVAQADGLRRQATEIQGIPILNGFVRLIQEAGKYMILFQVEGECHPCFKSYLPD